jgi:hypothetical protein
MDIASIPGEQDGILIAMNFAHGKITAANRFVGPRIFFWRLKVRLAARKSWAR